jgi:hypothetical protein
MLYIKIFMIFLFSSKEGMVADILTILFSKLGFLFVHFILDIGKVISSYWFFHNPVPVFQFLTFHLMPL